MADLFDNAAATPSNAPRPLADRLRPKKLEEVVGQDHILGPDGPLGQMLLHGNLSSLILWGPPGVGKTTIARLLADETDLAFVQISAIFTGMPELRKVFEAAKLRRQNGIVAGVCGGLGAFYGIKPFWFRLLFLILLLPGGLPAILPYAILWVVIPRR